MTSLALALPALFGALVGTRLPAQAPNPIVAPVTREFETRAQLEARAQIAEKQGRTSEVWLLRTRLQQGDFQEGDRIAVTIGNNPPRSDTMQVRAGKTLTFGGITDVSLAGVLRSELTDTVRYHLSKYLVNPVVRTMPLLPIAVFGNVGVPGYYYFPADVLLRDVVMRVGGIAAGDVKRAVVKRGNETIWKSADVRIALTDGLSLDRLHLRAGDEVYVPERKRPGKAMVFTALSTALSVYLIFARGGGLY
jgi:hypothetical protein